MSEALIFESVNPQYDKRLFIEFREKYIMLCTKYVANFYFSENSMNNLSSYCGLTDSRMRPSEKDLPVQCTGQLGNYFIQMTGGMSRLENTAK